MMVEEKKEENPLKTPKLMVLDVLMASRGKRE